MALRLIASDIIIIICIVGLCNLIGYNRTPAGLHWSFAVKRKVDQLHIISSYTTSPTHIHTQPYKTKDLIVW